MPLFTLSPNVQESEAASRKRTHEEFVDNSIQLAIDDRIGSENLREQKFTEMSTIPTNHRPLWPPLPISARVPTPGSSPVALTEAGSSQPTRESPSPNKTPSKPTRAENSVATQSTQLDIPPATAPTAQDTQSAKRKLTASEREEERAEKRQKKEAEAAEKQRRKDVELAEKVKKKAAEEATKAARRAKQDAAKAAKKAEDEAKKRKKEEEESAARRKQERQKNILASFIQRAPTAPSKKAAEQAMTSSPKPDVNHANSTQQTKAESEKTVYERTFHPFFLKHGVTLASLPFAMDEETKEAKSDILDQYIHGERGEFNPYPFNPVETFDFAFPQSRGIIPPSVKKIMEKVVGDGFQMAFDVTASRTESQKERLVGNAQGQLNSVPMKYLSFYEDVRPPYFGTVTSHMETRMLRKLSRRPVGRILQRLTYDYDSEAEWVEDEGEDLGDDDDDDDSHDGDEEMGDFLDDSEDVSTTIRPAFLGSEEPSSTGICFEDRTGNGPCVSMYKYRLEFFNDSLEHHVGIDPFSTSYWPNPNKATAKNANTAVSIPTPSNIPPPTALSGPLSKLVSGMASSSLAADPKELVPNEVFDDFKRAIISEEFREYTKGTIIDLLSKKFSPCTKAQVRATLDKIAHRVNVPGKKKSFKIWALLPEDASSG